MCKDVIPLNHRHALSQIFFSSFMGLVQFPLLFFENGEMVAFLFFSQTMLPDENQSDSDRIQEHIKHTFLAQSGGTYYGRRHTLEYEERFSV